MTNFETVRIDKPRAGIGRVSLARPEVRNAQNQAMLRELDAAFLTLLADDDVRVIVLAADGPDFSSGHDLKAGFKENHPPIASMNTDVQRPGIEGHFAFECEYYLGLCLRWRDMPKPTIAQVQGRAMAGGVMLVWPMDLVVASEDASFQDPVVAFGVNGVEYFTHLWEVGHRKAKEMLFTGDALSADEAYRLGMVNHVVSRERLEEFTLDLADKIAKRPEFGLRLAKAAVNQGLDAQGQRQALESALSLHNLGHANNLKRFDMVVHPDGAQMIREGAKR